jgi:hypothetical protein
MCNNYKIQLREPDITLEIIDTPGFNDTNGIDADTKNLTMIEKKLKEVPFLNGIILVINGSSPRLGISFKNFLDMLHQVWPNDLLNNCVAILTNCDELSVNLKSSVLENKLNIDNTKKFHLQNSLFRWNRKIESKKAIRRLQQNFEDNLGTIEALVNKLLQFDEVLTSSFTVGAIKISLIERCIEQTVEKMVNLLEKYKEQQVAQAGIEGARDVMENNKQWDKHREINAIRWVEVPRRPSPSQSQMYEHSRKRASYIDQSSTQTGESTPNAFDYYDDMNIFVKQSNGRHEFSSNPNSTVGTNRQYAQKPVQGKNDPSFTEIDGICHSMGSGVNDPTATSRTHGPTGTTGTYDHTVTNRKFSLEETNRVHRLTEINQSKHPEINQKGNHYCNSPAVCNNENQRHKESSTGSRSTIGRFFGCNGHPSQHSSSSHSSVYQQQQTKIQVTLPDNEARAQHNYAQQQEYKLKERTQYLAREKESLTRSIILLLSELKQQVADMRSINKNYNIIERNRDRLRSFRELIKYMGDEPVMLSYYDQTEAILSGKYKSSDV